jgi:hypothetical protein
MAKTKSSVIILKGLDRIHIDEDGAASEAITPGMLVQGTTSLAKFATAGGPAPLRVAMERDEMGKGIDDAYAAGDTVKVANLAPGDRWNALIASGQNIAANAWLEPAGDGTLRVFSAGTRIARALEAINNSAGPGNVRLRAEAY